MPENELKCCVSGSFFKFKPEIDGIIDEFGDLGITVLAPDKGWLYIPRHVLKPEDMKFRPLPTEIGMSPDQVEDEFLKQVAKSDFLYIVDSEGYAGSMASLEVGFAMGCGIPVFSKEPIKPDDQSDLWLNKMIDLIRVATPKEVRFLLKSGEKRRAGLNLVALEL